MAKYRIVSGLYGTREVGKPVVVYGPGQPAGDVVELTSAAAASLGVQVERVRRPLPPDEDEEDAGEARSAAQAPAGRGFGRREGVDTGDDTATPSGAPSGSAFAELTHEVTSEQAQRMAETAPDLQTLDLIAASERAHPQYSGGRVGVLRAIERRRTEFKG